ncbi:hypothetical protein [Rubrimonas cliftonensis]|uniref:VPEID-CTERM protein sorting domain-containing protein n=1 Tax=Rubrimonas cliftonensis TaxID=89524 RepID=A0A1H3X7J2_9RHOB|nr:hypothetical protein [Rubrimonas cliftonensis]SDZ95210.1 VPEID-CTERM protein sorting domain-containing protein [Rubrimonas cliftonensis]
MKTIITITTLFAATAANASGITDDFVVPEIDALAGVAALAVVGASVALVRERMKR